MNPLMYRQPPFPVLSFPVQGVLPHRRDASDEEDLATVILQIQKKRFYVDVKKNWRGRFMKIAEVGLDGRKSRILLTMTAADDLKDKLLDLVKVYEEIIKKESEQDADGFIDQGDKSSENNEDGLIKSHIVNYPHRRYYMDLKKNRRGYFLRLTMLSTSARIKLAVPAEGMRDLYNSINELLKTWWNRPQSAPDQKGIVLPEPKAFRIDNRTLYFDSISNRYGVFLRISQVWASSRTAITIPDRSLNQFRDIINELAGSISSASIRDEKNITEVPPECPEVTSQRAGSTPEDNPECNEAVHGCSEVNPDNTAVRNEGCKDTIEVKPTNTNENITSVVKNKD